MNTEVAWRVIETQSYLQDCPPRLFLNRKILTLGKLANGLQNFMHRPVRQPLRKMVNFAVWHAKHFSDFTNRQPRVHGNEAPDHGYMFGTPTLVNIVEKFVAARTANIDVNIGAIPTL